MKYHLVFLDSHAMNPGDMDMSCFKDLGKVTIYPRTMPEEVVARSEGADILIVNKVKITADIMGQLPDLRMVCVTATGCNNIDLAAAKEKGIVVCNAPDYSSQSVAQMVFAHLLQITNRIAEYAKAVRDGEWSASPDFCFQHAAVSELYGKTMGIIGFGNIGRRVSEIALAMGMNVLVVTSKAATDLPETICKKSLQEMLPHVDVLSLHCSLNPDTDKIINAKTLSAMKPSAILINTARGGVVDEKAVASALRSGKLRAYAADVMTAEPPSSDNPLLQAPNSYFTPHIAWASVEARRRLLYICEENIRAFLAGEPVNTVC